MLLFCQVSARRLRHSSSAKLMLLYDMESCLEGWELEPKKLWLKLAPYPGYRGV